MIGLEPEREMVMALGHLVLLQLPKVKLRLPR